MLHESISSEIISSAYEVQKELGHGFLEKVYENALGVELIKRGFKTEAQKPIKVKYKGQMVGHYIADLLVEDKVLVEIKSIEKLGNTQRLQVYNYLKATNLGIGLLINYGSSQLEIKRIINKELLKG